MDTLNTEGMLQELGSADGRDCAPTMGKLQKVRYTHDAMVDLIIQSPWVSQNELAAHFGYTPSWISNVLASDAFQERLAARREEIIDPALKATLEERFRAITIQSLTRLQEELAKPVVKPEVLLKAAELGAKSLGMGGHRQEAPPAPAADRLTVLADRLIVLQRNAVKGVVYENEAAQHEPAAAAGQGRLSAREAGGSESDVCEPVAEAVRAYAG